MTEVVETEPKIVEIREICDTLQNNATMLEEACKATNHHKDMTADLLRKQLSLVRECVTIQKKHYPKWPEIWTEMQSSEVLKMLGHIQSALTQKRAIPEDDVQRIRAWLEFPQRFHDSYGDLFEEQFQPWEQWMAAKLRELQEEHHDDIFWQGIEWTEKEEAKWKRRYEKEKEEFYARE